MDINPFVSVTSIIYDAIYLLFEKDSEKNYPVAHDQYSGDAKTYALFTIYNRLPEIFGSGKNHAVGAYGDIDVFSDEDLSSESSIIKDIAEALNAAGITVKDIRDIAYDGVSHHVLIEYYISKVR